VLTIGGVAARDRTVRGYLADARAKRNS
jgi:hypothetical protein